MGGKYYESCTGMSRSLCVFPLHRSVVQKKGLCQGLLGIFHLPPSLEPVGSIPPHQWMCPWRWMGQSRGWAGSLTAGTEGLFALPGQCLQTASRGCVPSLQTRGAPLSVLFPPLFTCRLHAGTEPESLFFPFCSYKMFSLILGRFLPRRCCSSAPVPALWLEDCFQWSQSSCPAWG